MEQKMFNLVADQVSAALKERGCKPLAGQEQPENGRKSVYTDEDAAYGVFYSDRKKQFALQTCGLKDDAPDEKWKIISTWLFDPANDTAEQEQDIAKDFVETICGPKQAEIVRVKKKHRKDDNNNVDPVFLFNRFSGVFPELKEELNTERCTYGRIRIVVFAREKLLPKLEELCSEGANESAVKRCGELMNELYLNGDLDVRSLVTIVLLDGLSERAVKNIAPAFDDNMKKGYQAGLRMKGKKVKPEKVSKTRKLMSQTLNDMDTH